MAMKLVNLTLLKLNEELESLLEKNFEWISQSQLQDSDFRQKLIAYVLNRIPNRYVAVDAENESSISSEFLIYSNQEALYMEKQICQGIYSLTKSDLNYYNFSHATYIEINSPYYHSSWFG